MYRIHSGNMVRNPRTRKGNAGKMRTDSMFDVLGGIVLVALATTIVTSRYTAAQVTAAGNAFSGVIAAALGKGSINR
jgi:hypothetical protein